MIRDSVGCQLNDTWGMGGSKNRPKNDTYCLNGLICTNVFKNEVFFEIHYMLSFMLSWFRYLLSYTRNYYLNLKF